MTFQVITRPINLLYLILKTNKIVNPTKIYTITKERIVKFLTNFMIML